MSKLKFLGIRLTNTAERNVEKEEKIMKVDEAYSANTFRNKIPSQKTIAI